MQDPKGTETNEASSFSPSFTAILEELKRTFLALRESGFTLQDLARFEKAFPDHRTIRFPSAKHFFFKDEFEAMVPQIQTFMSEVVARTAP